MKKIAIIVSKFNNEYTEKLLEGAKKKLLSAHIKSEHIKIVYVPGAVEIPLAASLLAKQKKYSAIIALGAVIRGDTSHYDYVCEQVSQGCQRV
ncbi:MAG: riboflavin synthase beta chain (6,7-dimethyl-8-ribityllumazine synthase), partial [uncultured bacterium]